MKYPSNLVTKELIQAIFSTLPLGLCITDEEGLFVFVNQSYLQIYGYTQEELLGQSFLKVVQPQDQKFLSQVHESFIRDGSEELTDHWQVINKLGELIDILAVANRFKGSDGRYYKVTMVTDITQKLSLRRQKMQSDRVLFHDLRSQIKEIETLVDEMLPILEEGSAQSQYANNIFKTTNQLRSSLVNTMDLNLIEEGNYKLICGKFSLNTLLQDLALQFEQRSSKAHVQLVFEMEQDPIELYSNEILLQGILENLIKNALEASKPGQKVYLRINKDERLVIEIENQGEIPEVVRDRFFQPYTTTKSFGTGLGTYSAYLQTKALGGNLTFTTGEGMTTLTLTLPFSKNEGSSA